jgi:hypothetical protein
MRIGMSKRINKMVSAFGRRQNPLPKQGQGADVRKICESGCIACRICEKTASMTTFRFNICGD